MFTKKKLPNRGPNKIALTLDAGCYLADTHLAEMISDGPTHIEAATGKGKSSFVIDTLSETRKVIFTVPQRAQIEQLKARNNTGKVRFLYGGSSSWEFWAKGQVIVCTYDTLDRVVSLCQPEHYVLVIDEVHKLYQAASYRNRVMNEVLWHVKNTPFANILTLSAQANLLLLPINYQHYVRVQTPPIDRTLNMGTFKDHEARMAFLANYLTTKRSGVAIVRINNKSIISEFKLMLEKLGLSVLEIHSQAQRNDDVKKALKNEVISDDFDVVLTTSLTDEAVNINNENIDSAHVVGGSMHSEEMLQFMGRFRRQTPQFYQHLISSDFAKVEKGFSLGKQRELLMNCAHAVADAFGRLAAESTPVTLTMIETVLSFCTEGADVRLIRPKRIGPDTWTMKDVEVDEAGINNMLYQLDTMTHYSSMDALIKRYQETITGLTVNVASHDAVADVDYMTLKGNCETEVKEAYIDAVDCCADAIGVNGTQVTDESIIEAEYAAEHLERYLENCVESSGDYQIGLQWRYLYKQCVENHNDAYDIMRTGQFDDVRDFVNDANRNPIAAAFMLEVNDISQGVLTEEQAIEVVQRAVRRVFRVRPELKEIISQFGNRSYIYVKKNNHVVVQKRLVKYMFENLCRAQVKRSNGNYKFIFESPVPFGYRLRIPYLGQTLTPKQKDMVIKEIDSIGLTRLRFLAKGGRKMSLLLKKRPAA